MRWRLILLIVLAALVLTSAGGAVGQSSGRVFYVSARGNDHATGLNRSHPWRTVRRVNAERLRPGDRVLFLAGDTFAGTTLLPRNSGTGQRPIVFGGYGRGYPTLQARQSAVFLGPGVSHLVFDGLKMTTGASSTSSIFASAAAGRGSVDVRITHSRLFATDGAGIISKKASDTDWLITHDTISDTGDSGLILWGAHATVHDSLIQDVGVDSSIPWGRHGIYAKGANVTVTDNVIRGFPSDGVSLRFPNARVLGNTIEGGGIGIAYFSFSPVAGVSVVEGNTIKNVRTAGFYYDPTAHAGGGYPRESFEFAHNAIQVLGGANAGIDVQGAIHSSMRIFRNELEGGFAVAIVANSPSGGSYYEENDTIQGAPYVRWNGQNVSVESYRSASGQGLRDTLAN